MNHLKDIENRIDDYLLERMSSAERQQFEIDLESDLELKKQFVARKEVVDSIQRVALRNFLREYEEERKAKPQVIFTGGFKEFISALSRYSVSRHFVSIGLSVAASLVIVLGGIRYYNLADSLQEMSVSVSEQQYIPTMRGDDENSGRLTQIRSLIDNKQYTEALVQIEELEYSLNSQDVIPENATEEEQYQHELLELQKQEAIWYKAVAYMGQGKVFRAKRVLKDIASEGGIYAKYATEILDEVYAYN